MPIKPKDRTYYYNVAIPGMLLLWVIGDIFTFFSSGHPNHGGFDVLVSATILAVGSLIWLGYGLYQFRKENIQNEKNHKNQ